MQETAVTRSVLGLGVNLFALPASAIPINPETKEPDAAAIAKVLSEPVSAHDIEFVSLFLFFSLVFGCFLVVFALFCGVFFVY